MRIRIDHKEVEAKEGMTIMQAAALLGISIPALCYHEGITHHASCMVCMVKDLDSGRMLPSCEYPALDGMNIQTHSHEIHEIRREALELLLSDHVGDCEAPCRRSCPAFMDIPEMNRLIAAGRFNEALKVVREEIALPLILGYICPAPCEKACHRASIDGALSICLLKRSTADEGARLFAGIPPMAGNGGDTIAAGRGFPHNTGTLNTSGKKVAIIGTGPSGLSAAFYTLRSGHQAVLFDQHKEAGGMLRYHITEEKLPRKALEAEIRVISQMGAEFRMNTLITREFFDNVLLREYHAVIIASGREEQQITDDFGLELDEHGLKVSRTTLEAHHHRGIFACGNIIRKRQMAVRSVAQGKAAALSADHYLKTGKPGPAHQMFNSSFGRLLETEFGEYLKESPAAARLEPAKGFTGGFTEAEAIKEAARCMNCDCRKPVTCKLRIYADEYQAHQKRFAGNERKLISKSLQHEFVVYEAEKCIKCGICVEITKSEHELQGLTYIGRGFDVRINVPLGGSMEGALVRTGKKVIEACPTGALACKINHNEKRRDS
ncbi:MAG: 2Fe-2S iron-sulfur cluster-binding protein [Bacteroidetes bacterium]|nr:2Fe-2S iron-sulfur cluster-binding protein [Bacteroidota bacterium]